MYGISCHELAPRGRELPKGKLEKSVVLLSGRIVPDNLPSSMVFSFAYDVTITAAMISC